MPWPAYPTMHFPILFAKLDIQDDFWQRVVSNNTSYKISYVLSQLDPSEPITSVVPLCLQMGWIRRPPFVTPHKVFIPSSPIRCQQPSRRRPQLLEANVVWRWRRGSLQGNSGEIFLASPTTSNFHLTNLEILDGPGPSSLTQMEYPVQLPVPDVQAGTCTPFQCHQDIASLHPTQIGQHVSLVHITRLVVKILIPKNMASGPLIS
jgi:hypothetical protein